MEYTTKNAPPSDVNQMYMVGRYELLKHLRSKRLYGIIIMEILIVVLMLAVPPLAGHDYQDDPAMFAGNFFNWVNILIIIGATLFAGDSLVSEFQNRTGYLIFPNPVKRTTFFMGKFAATAGIMFMVLVLYYALVSSASLVITGGVSELTAGSLGLALLFTISACGVGYLISSIMKGSTGALVFTFALLFMILPIIDGVFTFAKVKPDFSLTFVSGAIGCIMQTPYPTDFIRVIDIGGGQTMELATYFPEVTVAVAVMVVYAVVSVLLAMWFFNRREMVA